MNSSLINLKTTNYVGIGHILDINTPNYEELWADFYLNSPIKELKSVISIQRVDKYLPDKLLYATLAEVSSLDDYPDHFYKYTLKQGQYLKVEVELSERFKLPEVIDYAYNKSGYIIDKSEIIEFYEQDTFKLNEPKLALIFRIID